jgi:plasmid stabilization system protein ParE
MIVVVANTAEEDIAQNIDYIAERGSPINAGNLHKRMLDFIPTLGEMPEKYAI